MPDCIIYHGMKYSLVVQPLIWLSYKYMSLCLPAWHWIAVHAKHSELWGWGLIVWQMGSDLSSWLTPFLCQAYTGWCSDTSAYACTEAGGCCVDGLLLDHFQQLMVILYHNMPAKAVDLEWHMQESIPNMMHVESGEV